MKERTLVFVKPDGVNRGLTGEIILRFERRGLRVVALKMMTMLAEFAGEHYAAHRDKPFFAPLVEFITSGPVVAMVLEGESAVALARAMMGATNPADAAPGTIRGDFATETTMNVIHGSDSPESAAAEIKHFFAPEEIAD